MRSQLSRFYNEFWMPFKNYTGNLIRFIRNKDDNDFNNPFVIY